MNIRYLGPWLVLAGALILAGCSRPPEEDAQHRNNLAKAEDALAECRLFAQEENFKASQFACEKFLSKDQECASFPEQKEGCIQFIRDVDYTVNKLQCIEFSAKERNCAKLVDTKIPAWFYNAAKLVGLDWKKKTWIEWVLAFAPDIHLGVVWSGYGGRSFLDGLDLAVDEVNSQGGVLGRNFKLHLEITDGDLDKSRAIADRMGQNEKIRAVIGRQFSSNTIPVTYVYDTSNIVYLAVSATNGNVIRYGMRFIFRQVPNNDSFAAALVNLCVRQNYRKLAMLYTRDAYSEELSYAFRDYAVKNNLKIVFEKSFFKERQSFVDVAADMKELELDAVFIATLSETAARVVEDLRAMNIKAPLLGSDSLDSNDFARLVGEKGNGLVVPTIYNPFSQHAENAQFVKAYRNRYGNQPDTWAAQGYDAVKLLAHVMDKEVHSTVPASIATGMRYMSPQTGATGAYAYLKTGELAKKPIYFKELQHEEFILFKDTKQEEEQTQKIEIVNDRVILRPEKPSESTDAMSVY